MKLTFNLNVAETGETIGDLCVWDGEREWEWLEPRGINAYGMGNMNGNGWNHEQNGASNGANGALAHDLNNG